MCGQNYGCPEEIWEDNNQCFFFFFPLYLLCKCRVSEELLPLPGEAGQGQWPTPSPLDTQGSQRWDHSCPWGMLRDKGQSPSSATSPSQTRWLGARILRGCSGHPHFLDAKQGIQTPTFSGCPVLPGLGWGWQATDWFLGHSDLLFKALVQWWYPSTAKNKATCEINV